MMNRLFTIARVEFVSVARLRWIRMFALAFALLAVGAAWSAGAARDLGGADGFARTTVTLVPLVLLLVPLVAILLGITGQTTESGSDAFLFAQPVTRFEVLVARWAGQSAALGTALAFVSLATLVAALVERRVAALAVGAFLWFFFVLLFDALALGAATWLTGRAGTRLLMASVFANPADLMRVLTLSLAGTPNLLGAAGESWHRFLGGPVWATSLSCIGLLAWVCVPLAAARIAIARRDL
jgi:ABC-type transport system involved in multi-copper enzyme maturation permease subunit